jgi:hypothetical protein
MATPSNNGEKEIDGGSMAARNGRPSSLPSRKRRKGGGRSIRAVETTPAASLNAGGGEELSSALV